MTRAKRKLPSSPDQSERKGKRTHREAVDEKENISHDASLIANIIDVDNDEPEEDIDTILARIRDHEKSMALARKLQAEWTTPAGTSAMANDVFVVDEEEEDDEAMARRLAREWELEDDNNFEAISAVLAEPTPPSSPSRRPPSPMDIRPSKSVSDTSDSHAWWDHQPPDEKLVQFRSLFTSERKCSKCGNSVKSPRGHVMFTSNPPRNLTVLLHAPCSVCHTNHCRGCFTPVSCPASCKGSIKNRTCRVESCCAEGRAIAVFEALGGFDRQYISERATSESRTQAAIAKQKNHASSSVGPGGTGYGTDSYGCSGRGYRGNSNSNKSTRRNQLAEHWEELVTNALNTLTDLLPSPYDDSTHVYDMLPHPSLGPLLSLSQLPELLGTLLRNDSVMDWIPRCETYYAMIRLLRRLADCELTVQTLIAPRWEKEKSCGIEEWMWGEGDIRWARNKEGIEHAPPLYEHFKKLTKQCQAFLAGASHMMVGDDDAEDVEDATVKAMGLCGDMIAARDDMERVMAILKSVPGTDGLEVNGKEPAEGEDGVKGKGKGKGRDPSIDMEKEYSLDCERLAFKHVTLSEDKKNGTGLTYPNFLYSTQLNQTASSTRNPKNRLHLVKELAVMATCLPPGVWVRIDEVRNDAIKVMIAGPEDTPYAGGLFEFDCFMPIEYPNTPPLMHLRTTGGGRVRFNPNLYANGKVCLSLLGTWPGRPEEQWSPRSSLLQVLVSIQSMILIDAPYFNEPGCGKANVAAPVSISYNRNIALQTVRWAMVEWLKEEHRDGIWGEVIASHFRIRGKKIRQRIQEWAAKDPRIRAYHPNSADVAGTATNVPCTVKGGYVPGIDLVDEFDLGLKRMIFD